MFVSRKTILDRQFGGPILNFLHHGAKKQSEALTIENGALLFHTDQQTTVVLAYRVGNTILVPKVNYGFRKIHGIQFTSSGTAELLNRYLAMECFQKKFTVVKTPFEALSVERASELMFEATLRGI